MADLDLSLLYWENQYVLRSHIFWQIQPLTVFNKGVKDIYETNPQFAHEVVPNRVWTVK